MSEKETSNFKQALWLAVSQLSVAILSFLSAAILSRYFDKYDYGTYKQVLYVYNTLSSLFIIGLPSVFTYYIPRLNSGEQKTLIRSLNRIFLGLGFLFSLALFFGSDLIADILDNPDLKLALKIFSPFPLFTLPTLGVSGIYTALKKARYLAGYNIASKIICLIFIVAPVIIFKTGWIGALIGWGVANFLIFLISMYMKNKPYVEVKAELVPNMYKTVFGFCLPLVGAFVGGFIIRSAPQFFISRYYGTEVFADFSNGAMTIPFAAMIAGSVKQVLVPVISKSHHEGNYTQIRETYTNACTNSLTLVFPILIFCMVFAKPLMLFVYGSKYAASAPFLQANIVREFCEVLPYAAILMAFGHSKLYMHLHWAGAAFIWIADALSVYVFHWRAEMIVFNESFWQIISSAIVFYIIFRKYRLNLFSKKLVQTMIKVAIQCFIVAFASYYLLWWTYGCIKIEPASVITLIAGGLIFLILLWFTGKTIGIDYLNVVKRFKK